MKKALYTILTVLLISITALTVSAFERVVPILMYHSIDDSGELFCVSEAKLEKDITDLKNAGYSFVSFDELINFVYNNGNLPQKSIVITFDDGYKNNFTSLAEMSYRLGFCYEIFCVGSYVDYAPNYLDWWELQSINSSGFGSIGCHTYNLHDETSISYGISRVKDTDFRTWEHAVRNDLDTFKTKYRMYLGKDPVTFAYPYGAFCADSEQLLKEEGYKVTVTTEPGVNIIRKNDADSLRLLMRISIDGRTESALDAVNMFFKAKSNELINEVKKQISAKDAMGTSYVSRAEALYMLYGDTYNRTKTQSAFPYYTESGDAFDTDDFMNWCASMGIISGYEDGLLHPRRYITRGEFAVILARKAGVEPKGVPGRIFLDEAEWNASALKWCSSSGLMIGYPDGTFGCNDIMTKEQLETVKNRIY